MGAGASTGYELSSADKVQIAKAIEETYDKGKDKDDVELFKELKRYGVPMRFVYGTWCMVY
ncbi:hypothetical protein EON63_07155 [archaeon]|nr:MAG: hypothetical protein EON63_07155 [archaeon]